MTQQSYFQELILYMNPHTFEIKYIQDYSLLFTQLSGWSFKNTSQIEPQQPPCSFPNTPGTIFLRPLLFSITHFPQMFAHVGSSLLLGSNFNQISMPHPSPIISCFFTLLYTFFSLVLLDSWYSYLLNDLSLILFIRMSAPCKQGLCFALCWIINTH